MINLKDIHILKIPHEIQKFFEIPLKDASVFAGFKRKYDELSNSLSENHSAIMSYIEDYNLLLGFEEYNKRRTMTFNTRILLKKGNLRSFISFACSFQRLYYAASSIEKNQLISSLIKGLNGRLFPFQHEVDTAIYLNHLRFELKWQDGINGNNYEYSATKNQVTFAIECKTIYRYAGSPIIEAAANDFAKQIDWDSIESNLNRSSIILFPFEGKLTQDPKSNTHTSNSLAQDFNSKIKNHYKGLDIRELSVPTKITRRWVAERITDIEEEYPLARVLFPLFSSSKKNKCCYFIALIPKTPSSYMAAFESQLDKAFVQVQGNIPGVIYIYPEGLTSELLSEVGNVFSDLINRKLSEREQPLMCCVRTGFKNELVSKGDLLWHSNKAFQPFLSLFNLQQSS